MSALIPTPERLDTTQNDQIMIEHLHRYALAANYVKDKIILDIASGEGYGTNLLSATAKFAYGVDISSEAIAHAQNKYKQQNIAYKQGSATQIPLDDSCVDVIISFETIEHHDQHDEMLMECKRVLKPGGLMIISSPEKKYYSDISNYKNPYHVKELYQHEFKELLAKHFGNAQFLNQKYLSASVILTEGGNSAVKEYGGSYDKLLKKVDFTPIYIIALVSDGDIPKIESSIFIHQQTDNKIADAIAQKYTSSTTWKLGKLILSPLVFIRELLKL